MKLLLDTHVVLWALSSEKTLSREAKETIASNTNIVLVSIASLWELRIKETLGKVTLPKNFYTSLQPAGYEILPISLAHITTLGALPHHHRDPFDRMLIVQAQCEQAVLVTRDDTIKQYKIDILWA